MEHSKGSRELLRQMALNLFPRQGEYPVNSMHPVVLEGKEGPRLAMLVIGDGSVKSLLKDCPEPDISSSVYLEDNRYGIRRDLVIRFDVSCTAGMAGFETVIPGDERRAQELVIRVLGQPAEVGIFVLDEAREFVAVLRAPWQPSGVSAGVFSRLEEL